MSSKSGNTEDKNEPKLPSLPKAVSPEEQKPEEPEKPKQVDFEALKRQQMEHQELTAKQMLDLRMAQDRIEGVLHLMRIGLFPGEMSTLVSDSQNYIGTLKRGMDEQFQKLKRPGQIPVLQRAPGRPA